MNLASLAGEPTVFYIGDQQFRVRPANVRQVARLQAWINAHPPVVASSRPPDHAEPPAVVKEARGRAAGKWQPPEAISEDGLAHLTQTDGGAEHLLQLALSPEHPEVDEALAGELANVLPYLIVRSIFWALASTLNAEGVDDDEIPKFLRPPTAASPGTTTPATSDDASESVTPSS